MSPPVQRARRTVLPEPAEPEPPARIVRTGAARARTASAVQHGQRHTTASVGSKREVVEETEETEAISSVVFPPGVEPAFVRTSVGKTISMGPGTYEFLRIDVSVTLPCMADTASLQLAADQASEFVAQRLQEEEIIWMGRPSTATRRG